MDSFNVDLDLSFRFGSEKTDLLNELEWYNENLVDEYCIFRTTNAVGKMVNVFFKNNYLI